MIIFRTGLGQIHNCYHSGHCRSQARNCNRLHACTHKGGFSLASELSPNYQGKHSRNFHIGCKTILVNPTGNQEDHNQRCNSFARNALSGTKTYLNGGAGKFISAYDQHTYLTMDIDIRTGAAIHENRQMFYFRYQKNNIPVQRDNEHM